MSRTSRPLLSAAIVLVLAAPTASAADKCVAKAVIGGKAITLKSCAVALYDEQGVTLVMTEAPLSAEELSTFQLNSYPPERDANGKKRAILSLSFCPGGGKPGIN
ncbi:MAG TPA: hypothetical protein VIY96_05985, partial [Thermoanaerobaculia bacterium]